MYATDVYPGGDAIGETDPMDVKDAPVTENLNSMPFVTTAALREEDNRIEVTMTTDDEKYAAQVLNFDTIGGAIEFRYSIAINDIAFSRWYAILNR